MKKHTVQQEILLVTNGTFSQQQWCAKDITESGNQLSQLEQPEQACWNGLPDESFLNNTKILRRQQIFYLAHSSKGSLIANRIERIYHVT